MCKEAQPVDQSKIKEEQTNEEQAKSEAVSPALDGSGVRNKSSQN